MNLDTIFESLVQELEFDFDAVSSAFKPIVRMYTHLPRSSVAGKANERHWSDVDELLFSPEVCRARWSFLQFRKHAGDSVPAEDETTHQTDAEAVADVNTSDSEVRAAANAKDTTPTATPTAATAKKAASGDLAGENYQGESTASGFSIFETNLKDVCDKIYDGIRLQLPSMNGPIEKVSDVHSDAGSEDVEFDDHGRPVLFFSNIQYESEALSPPPGASSSPSRTGTHSHATVDRIRVCDDVTTTIHSEIDVIRHTAAPTTRSRDTHTAPSTAVAGTGNDSRRRVLAEEMDMDNFDELQNEWEAEFFRATGLTENADTRARVEEPRGTDINDIQFNMTSTLGDIDLDSVLRSLEDRIGQRGDGNDGSEDDDDVVDEDDEDFRALRASLSAASQPPTASSGSTVSRANSGATQPSTAESSSSYDDSASHPQRSNADDPYSTELPSGSDSVATSTATTSQRLSPDFTFEIPRARGNPFAHLYAPPTSQQPPSSLLRPGELGPGVSADAHRFLPGNYQDTVRIDLRADEHPRSPNRTREAVEDEYAR